MALKGDLGAGVGFLQLHAPVAQVGQRDRLAAHRAPHDVAWDQHLELTVEIAKPGLAPETKEPLKPIHASSPFGRERVAIALRPLQTLRPALCYRARHHSPRAAPRAVPSRPTDPVQPGMINPSLRTVSPGFRPGRPRVRPWPCHAPARCAGPEAAAGPAALAPRPSHPPAPRHGRPPARCQDAGRATPAAPSARSCLARRAPGQIL